MAIKAKQLKIGFVFDDSLDKPDGVQQYIISLGTWLTSQGHEVHYLVGQTSRTDLPNIHSLSRNINMRFNGNRMSIPLPASRARIRQLLLDQGFDVLHVQVPYSPWLAHRIIKASPPTTAVIGTFHIVAYSRLVIMATRFLAWRTRRSLTMFDQIVSVSDAAASYAKVTYSLNTYVLPNVVDYERFSNALPLSELDDDKITIMFLGRLVPRKGCDLLLQAVEKLSLKSKCPKFKVVICGGGPLKPDFEQFVTDKGLNEIVTFKGFIDEQKKPRYYASADISVFPSKGGESFGIVLIEAMASGRAAVLGGDNSGYRSVLAPKPEVLIDTRSSDHLTELLYELLTDEKRRKELASWGKDYTRQFDTSSVGSKLIIIYKEALLKRVLR